MLTISEIAISTPEHGVIHRANSYEGAQAAVSRYVPELPDYAIAEEKRPAAAVGFCVAVGGMDRTWELVVSEPDPKNGLYPVTECAALALGISDASVLLRSVGIVTLSSELMEYPEISGNINTTHNKLWSPAEEAARAVASGALNAQPGKNWQSAAYGPALRRLLDERHARHAYTAF